ncbi:hypothetical protein [Acetatifactor aquisgranensis]
MTKLVNGLIPRFVEDGALSGRVSVNGMEWEPLCGRGSGRWFRLMPG